MGFQKLHEPQVLLVDNDSTSSTPYVSAPSSPRPEPGSTNGGFFYSAPASPMHITMTTTPVASVVSSTTQPSPPGHEFEFGSSGSGQSESMTSADGLFLNGQIRPLKLSTHLERPKVLAPLMDKPLRRRRRRRSMSPLRNAVFALNKDLGQKAGGKNNGTTGDSMSGACSSDGRSSRKWGFGLKGFRRSKSEGRKWSSTVSKEKQSGNKSNGVVQEKLSNGIRKKRVPPSPHELHYTANIAQAEEMRRKTFLPYRQGLLGCLGFSSKGYGAMNGLARAVNPLPSR
ncbi:uncharacterized protein LOC120124639 [Hibiscus syriacus]|uniref:uncharacterized protein LOC120124639 n=1 Tax=Hibiscus syriacus TaxID=106335 RepID=UPI0019246A66|nr:uncharacterized protein LOC120124639 [Hibiscus syriacus]